MARQWAGRCGALNPLIVGEAPPPYHIHDHSGERIISPLHLTWQDAPPKSPEIVLLSIKWRSMEKARQWIKEWAPHSLVISLMNGMGQEEALANIPGITLSAGITTMAATRRDTNDERHTYLKAEGSTMVAATHHPLERHLMAANENGQWGWHWASANEAQLFRWQKLVQNSIINPLTALADCPNGDLPAHPLWRLAPRLAQEAGTVAMALGVKLPQNMLERVEKLLRQTHENISSMLQDVREGRETEVFAINGYLVQQGSQLAIPPPTHQALLSIISALTPVTPL